MADNRRGLRSAFNRPSPTALAPSTVPSSVLFAKPSIPPNESIRIVSPGSKIPGLSKAELKLLREKQRRLEVDAFSTLSALPGGPQIRSGLEATLIFAQYEAGTAVCIDPSGWALTCAHCFGDTEEEYLESDKRRWLLFYTGLAVQVECRIWDGRRDLALLKIIAIESVGGGEGESPMFASVPVFAGKPSYKMSILCIGQPGKDDLESTSARQTKYNLVEVSEGTFRGMVRGADPQDNSDIGTLMHDAWTYWGHSGAPLLREADGTLIGLHSSWDDGTAMRHGIPQAAIQEFLQQQVLIPVPLPTNTAEASSSAAPVGGAGLGTVTSPIVIP